jgi:hypothetical protein
MSIRLDIPADHPAATRAARAFFNALLEEQLKEYGLTDGPAECECLQPTREYLEQKLGELEEQLDLGMASVSPFAAPPVGPHGGVMVPVEQFNSGTIPQPVTTQIMTPTPPLPTTESLLAGNGVPGYDGVPYTPPTPPIPTPPALPRSGAKLDADGLPWDRRIHASTKTLRQSDGSWKLIRGVSDELVHTVKAELRLAMGQAQAVTLPPAAPTIPVPPAGVGFADPATNPSAVPLPSPLAPPAVDPDAGWPSPPAGPVAAAVIPTPPILTLVPPVAPAPPAPPATDPFPEFVQFCTAGQQSGRLQYQAIVDTCTKYGITQLPMLNARHDLIPTIRAELEALCKP